MSVYWRATLHWFNTVTSLNAQNVLHFEDLSNVKSAEEVGEIIDLNWWQGGTTNDRLRHYTSGHVKLSHITLQQLKPGPLGSVPYITTQATGTQGTAVKHPVLGMVFQIKDGTAGRRGRGRFYHYGAVPSHLLDNGPSSALFGTAVIPTLISRWMNQFGPAPASGLWWNLRHRGVDPEAEFTRVISIQLSPRCSVQRRRNFGVGL